MDELGILITVVSAIGGAWLTVKIREAKMHEKIIYVEKEQARIEKEQMRIEDDVKELRKETKKDMTEIYKELKAVREGIDFIKGRMSK